MQKYNWHHGNCLHETSATGNPQGSSFHKSKYYKLPFLFLPAIGLVFALIYQRQLSEVCCKAPRRKAHRFTLRIFKRRCVRVCLSIKELLEIHAMLLLKLSWINLVFQMIMLHFRNMLGHYASYEYKAEMKALKNILSVLFKVPMK